MTYCHFTKVTYCYFTNHKKVDKVEGHGDTAWVPGGGFVARQTFNRVVHRLFLKSPHKKRLSSSYSVRMAKVSTLIDRYNLLTDSVSMVLLN